MKTCPACHHQQNSDEALNCSACGFSFQPSIKPTDPDSSYLRTSGFSPGDRIANRYEVVKELGHGGMGVVYLVKDTLLQNRQEALKMIHPLLVENPQARQRFEQEVGICLDLLHSNIVRVHDLQEWQGQPYFTMEHEKIRIKSRFGED